MTPPAQDNITEFFVKLFAIRKSMILNKVFELLFILSPVSSNKKIKQPEVLRFFVKLSINS